MFDNSIRVTIYLDPFSALERKIQVGRNTYPVIKRLLEYFVIKNKGDVEFVLIKNIEIYQTVNSHEVFVCGEINVR